MLFVQWRLSSIFSTINYRKQVLLIFSYFQLSFTEVVFHGVVFHHFDIFKVILTPTRVYLQLLESKSVIIRTGADGWAGGQLGAQVAGIINIKANAAQLSWGLD